MKYYYFKEEWEIADYRYISYFKITAKSLKWSYQGKSEFIQYPSRELKKILKNRLMYVTREAI